jgi:glycosyltransferase involved in cell wall biosynthesis
MTRPSPLLLYVDVKRPTPDHDAASQRSMQLLGQFVRWGFSVDFAAAFTGQEDGGRHLDELGVTTLPSEDAEALREYIGNHPGRYDIVVLCWARVASRLLDSARAANPGAFVVFDTVDVNHVREYRHARVTANARILRRAMVTKERELACVAGADCTLAITETDAQTLRAACPEARVEVVTLQAPALRPAPPANPRGRRGSLFLGNLQAAANVDAARYLVNDILPELRPIGGDTLTTIAGSQPPDVVRALGDDVEEVRVTDHVEDLGSLFDAHAVFACPLRFGSGVKGKLLTAMAFGLPAVVTPIAAEGMALEHEREVLIADTPAAFAAAVLRVQREPELRRSLISAATRHLGHRHSSSVLEAQMRRVFCSG